MDILDESIKFKTFTDFNAPEEFRYLEQLILYRLNVWFPSEENISKPIPDINNWSAGLLDFIKTNDLNEDEATLLLIGIAPYVQPNLFDDIISKKLKNPGDFQKIGGKRGKDFRGFLPTGETAIFLLGDDNFERRLEIQKLFWADHLFKKKKVLWLADHAYGEPEMSAKIMLSHEYLDTFIYNKAIPSKFSYDFPVKLIHTDLSWDDLVINEELKEQVDEIKSWLNYNDQLVAEWKVGDRLKKGYRTLLYGPSSTGKTLTAALLGKETGKDVYQLDLSMVVSKYIGETEKNLELLFARAEDKGWILFFDEADALFGKRTNVRDAHDKYANQEVSYLLQRIEEYKGLVILATNKKKNMDAAFIRRFDAVLKFTLPEAEERAKIWKSAFPKDVIYYNDQHEIIDIPEIVKSYALSGGSIVNAVHYSSIKALERNNENIKQKNIYLNDVLNGIKKELVKEGKPFS
jgi:AAA+ superfamily predicted ATPase